MTALAWCWAAPLAVGLPLDVAGLGWPGRKPTRHAGTPTGTGAGRAELDLRDPGELTGDDELRRRVDCDAARA
ncbi:MAG TPA: hypothetical protein VG276_18755 [Actinomycetes bacterium]|nr:hypothetical protein [Actinomycetes bacterium]